MTAKVAVSREVAEALDECKRKAISTDCTLLFHAQNGLTGKYAPLQTLTIGELAKALIIGYEIADSPEESLRRYYERNQDGLEHAIRFGWADTEYMAKGTAHGVKSTLRILGIKIEGVNA